MIADLSMYDWPGVRAETDVFWGEVARRLGEAGIEAPAGLTRGPDAGVFWRDPDLLLGQTCGMPFVCGLCGDARIIARPDYGLPGASGGFYRSVILVRAEDAAGTGPEAVLAQRGRRVAVNEWRSFSGHVALRAYLAGLRVGASDPFFGEAVMSGAHVNSARIVVRGEADVAALDGVAWVLLQRLEPEIAERLAVLDMTALAPALPFIAAPRFAGLRAELVSALAGAAAALPPVPGRPRAVAPADDGDYEPVRAVAHSAATERFASGAPEMSNLLG
ncbi:MAG TPA: PhnD/SsuA/transferrin family substrate-binding protein [Thermohalobaculum sp.]|nr:PhnD/SsuA/transferrin family substrate-binding protein [Thermohalobaculum sp.]